MAAEVLATPLKPSEVKLQHLMILWDLDIRDGCLKENLGTCRPKSIQWTKIDMANKSN